MNLQGHKFSISHRKGKKHVVADALFRMYSEELELVENYGEGVNALIIYYIILFTRARRGDGKQAYRYMKAILCCALIFITVTQIYCVCRPYNNIRSTACSSDSVDVVFQLAVRRRLTLVNLYTLMQVCSSSCRAMLGSLRNEEFCQKRVAKESRSRSSRVKS